MKRSEAQVLLVATHADLVDRTQSNVERLSARVLADARAFIAAFMSAIEKDIRNIESNRSISSALSVYDLHLPDSTPLIVHRVLVLPSPPPSSRNRGSSSTASNPTHPTPPHPTL